MCFSSLLLQQTAPAAAVGGGGLGMLIPLLLLVLIMYFFMIRPQNKKQKETQKMLDALKKGDKVVTIGGIHGTISSVKEHTVVIKVDDSAKIEFNRSAVASVIVEKTSNSKNADKSDKSDDSSNKNKEVDSGVESESGAKKDE